MPPRPKAAPAAPPPKGWVRTHFDNSLLAEVRWLGNQYEIIVSKPAEHRTLHQDCCRESGALALKQADRVVVEMYPHTCKKADCGPWLEVGPPPRS